MENPRKTQGARPRWQLAVLWTLSMLLFPVLLAQGMRTRRAALRLPEALGPREGLAGEGEPRFSVIGIGDSVIAGVGIDEMKDGLVASIAAAIHTRRDIPVQWLARGENGAKLADLCESLRRTPLPPADMTVVSIGVNDVSGLTSLIRWQMQVMDLMALLGPKRRVILLGVPPMEYFQALPQPLRWVLGIRAALLDKTLQQLGEYAEQVTWLNIGEKFDAGHLASDGYHPNALACVEIASEMVEAVFDNQKKVARIE